MPGLRILIGNEPRAYRDVLSASLRVLRPEAEVLTVEPAELDGAVERWRPQVVLCSRLTEAVRGVLAWILIYPDGSPSVEVAIGGAALPLPGDLPLERLLAAVDLAGRRAAGADACLASSDAV